MKTSDKGIELIKKHEALRLTAYLCPANVPTIGYGHTQGVKIGMIITEKQADDFLREDLQTAENAVNRENLNINQNQFDALVSFVFNVGTGNFRKSTLLKKLKANPNDNSIISEFAKWKYAKGRELKGLVKRRKQERDLYFKIID